MAPIISTVSPESARVVWASAPARRSASSTASSPLAAASQIGATPYRFFALTLAFARISALTRSEFPFWTAQCRAVVPSCSVPLTSVAGPASSVRAFVTSPAFAA